MSFDSIFRNKLSRPATRPSITGGSGERSIVWSSAPDGVLARLESLEQQVDQLSSKVQGQRAYESVADLDPDPGVVAVTGYDMASDGALRAYAEVTVSGTGIYEVALLGAPEVVYASKDAYVREDQPTTNYGTANILAAGQPGVGNAYRSWLQFDWGAYPDGLWAVEPAYAVVRLANDGGNVDGVALALAYEDFAGADWDESGGGGITWGTQEDIGYNLGTVATISGTGTGYTYFDATSFFFMLREAKSGSWTGTPYGLVIEADPEADSVGLYDWVSLQGAATDDERPQLWYWPTAEKAQLMGGSVRAAKLYGTPGGTYYLVHRRIDADNRTGRWSDPLELTLPAQGATPETPAAATKEDTQISHFKTIILTTTVPTDFDHFHVYIKETVSSTVKEFNTRVDRFSYWFPFSYAAGGGSYEVKYKIVTRSGVESAYSTNLTFSVTSNLKIQSPNGDNWLSLIDASGLGATVLQMAGNVADFIVSGDDGDYTVRTDKVKTITFDNILNSCGQASNDSTQSTTSTSWVDRTTGSITLTPPGSGNAYYLLIARATVFKNAADGMKLTFKADGTETNAEEAWSSSSVAETVTIIRRVAVTAGSSHTFKLCFKSNDGGDCIVYKSNVVALHLGNY